MINFHAGEDGQEGEFKLNGSKGFSKSNIRRNRSFQTTLLVGDYEDCVTIPVTVTPHNNESTIQSDFMPESHVAVEEVYIFIYIYIYL